MKALEMGDCEQICCLMIIFLLKKQILFYILIKKKNRQIERKKFKLKKISVSIYLHQIKLK